MTCPDSIYHSGELIGDKYRLLRSLGEGAMAWVWLARHENLGLPVALKIMKPEAAADPLHEARMTAGLRHPSIVTVFDSGRTPSGEAFFVMEHLEGSSLSEVLRRDGPLPARPAVSLLLPVLDALALCHEQGIVHRDLKPGNIFFSRVRGRTQAKLLDFGIAKPLGVPNTQAELAGTPGYMAPEQADGTLPLDHRADLWAFCAVLYECISGRPAIEGKNCLALLTATAEPIVPPLRESDGGVSALWPILEKGLRKNPADRFPVAAALRDTLTDWLAGDSQPARARVDSGAVVAANGNGAANGNDSPRTARPRRHVQWAELREAS